MQFFIFWGLHTSSGLSWLTRCAPCSSIIRAAGCSFFASLLAWRIWAMMSCLSELRTLDQTLEKQMIYFKSLITKCHIKCIGFPKTKTKKPLTSNYMHQPAMNDWNKKARRTNGINFFWSHFVRPTWINLSFKTTVGLHPSWWYSFDVFLREYKLDDRLASGNRTRLA